MRINRKEEFQKEVTFEGGRADRITELQRLRRMTLACMLWEDNFYIDGKDAAVAIDDTAIKCRIEDVRDLALEAKHKGFLRHIPLYLLLQIIRRSREFSLAPNAVSPVMDAVESIVTRPDDMTELLALYWKSGRTPLSNALKRGLALAFRKFDAYQLAKWNKDTPIKLRDVLFLVHPKPKSELQAEVWKKLANKSLESPKTYETVMGEKEGKKEGLEELLNSGKMGYTALLMNLRNMTERGIDTDLIRNNIKRTPKNCRVLPFQFYRAAKENPQYSRELEFAMIESLKNFPRLTGKTVILMDVSASMTVNFLFDKGGCMALMACCLADKCKLYTFSEMPVQVIPFPGFGLLDTMRLSQVNGMTYLATSLELAEQQQPDRIIIVTDEQIADINIRSRRNIRKYVINIAPYRNGISYKPGWTNITGFSPHSLSYICECEKEFDVRQQDER